MTALFRFLSLALLPVFCFGQTPVVDASGREIKPPARVERVFAAGPPASVLVFAIAPEKLVGWTRGMRPNEAQFFDERYAALPELGRLTGRGDTANVEVVLRAKADLIVDAGGTGPSLAELASSVESRTRIPYALFDGRIEATPASLRALGRLMGDEARAEALARGFQPSSRTQKTGSPASPAIHRCITAGAPPACRPAARARSTSRCSSSWARATPPPRCEPGSSPFRSSRSCSGIRRSSSPPIRISFASPSTDARWQSVEAVKARRVFLSPHLPFGWFDFPPGANRLLGIWWAGALLYPTEFDIDLRAKAAEFHRRFYHRAPTPAQLDALLGEPGVLPR